MCGGQRYTTVGGDVLDTDGTDEGCTGNYGDPLVKQNTSLATDWFLNMNSSVVANHKH